MLWQIFGSLSLEKMQGVTVYRLKKLLRETTLFARVNLEKQRNCLNSTSVCIVFKQLFSFFLLKTIIDRHLEVGVKRKLASTGVPTLLYFTEYEVYM